MLELPILRGIYCDIESTLGQITPEAGGIIGQENGVITAYEYDEKSSISGAYEPNISRLNTTIEAWNNVGISFAGIVHSHPLDICYPSDEDILYARRILSCNECLNEVIFSIVTLQNEFCMRTFVITADSMVEIPHRIIEDRS